jgi:uncharacterized membrane protein
VRTPPIQRFLVVQFCRLPREVGAILGIWALLGMIVAYIPAFENNVPPVAVLIFCAPACLFVLLIAVCMAEGLVRRLLTPFFWIARRLHRHG